MSNKTTKEWTVDLPWGKVAVIAWGDSTKPPMLLVHGYMDTAATFIPLVNELTDSHYYVAFDMPGHGKSENFPTGQVISQIHIIEVIHRIVKFMKWDRFVYMAHSMGVVIGLFYNYVYPNKVSRMIHLDPGPPISMYYYVHHKLPFWFNYIYTEYYDSFKRWNSSEKRRYTYDDALSLVVRNRNLSEEQAEVILARSLDPVAGDKFELSWQPSMKKISNVSVSDETLYTSLTANSPPTLVIAASESSMVGPAKSFALNILEKCQNILPNFYVVTISGGHDVHITMPEVVAEYIVKFLNYKRNKLWSMIKSKI
ncbi:serine hydrolase-like protein [Bombyx mori]|uniref:AB hydrolase-1 domain-containing protein n=1 Tax=Bombyx mori TaxID=7091 RepID=A0A8R1WJU0_BOMMO|nr:serine hydrolase-like protein [Bombyx mori]XP_037875796.1 serine hydrolase-like protein [Bombyx mori]